MVRALKRIRGGVERGSLLQRVVVRAGKREGKGETGVYIYYGA
jgi:hypothetical protein